MALAQILIVTLIVIIFAIILVCVWLRSKGGVSWSKNGNRSGGGAGKKSRFGSVYAGGECNGLEHDGGFREECGEGIDDFGECGGRNDDSGGCGGGADDSGGCGGGTDDSGGCCSND
ncbi:UNVERIFIED_CONTAM: hypothetical protein RMT77_010936 [Armadillidium vulgare]